MRHVLLHPDRDLFRLRLTERTSELLSPWAGEVYRFVNPRYSRPAELFGGAGAAHVSGRWHLAGMGRVSYASLEPETAMAESLSAVRYHGFPASQATPLVLVGGRMTLQKVLDLRCGTVRQRLRIGASIITETDWQAENAVREALTQAWGWAMLSAGVEAVITPSAASPRGHNMVLFPDNLMDGSRAEVIRAVVWPK